MLTRNGSTVVHPYFTARWALGFYLTWEMGDLRDEEVAGSPLPSLHVTLASSLPPATLVLAGEVLAGSSAQPSPGGRGQQRHRRRRRFCWNPVPVGPGRLWFVQGALGSSAWNPAPLQLASRPGGRPRMSGRAARQARGPGGARKLNSTAAALQPGAQGLPPAARFLSAGGWGVPAAAAP